MITAKEARQLTESSELLEIRNWKILDRLQLKYIEYRIKKKAMHGENMLRIFYISNVVQKYLEKKEFRVRLEVSYSHEIEERYIEW